VKREKDLNYFKMTRPNMVSQADAATNTNVCPEKDINGNTLKVCGTGSENEYKMCIPEKFDCPVQHLSFD